MAGVTVDFAEAVRLTSEVLAIKGVIYPSTTSNVHLRAELEDGSWVEGETRITASRKRIRCIQLAPSDAHPLPDALDAIDTADLITIGPGSLYTSLIPNMLVNEVINVVRASSAIKIYIQNIMTQPGETEMYSAADHVEALAQHCGGILFSNVLLNNGNPSNADSRRGQEHAHEIEIRKGSPPGRRPHADRACLAESASQFRGYLGCCWPYVR